jgi:uncharacterized membrane protein
MTTLLLLDSSPARNTQLQLFKIFRNRKTKNRDENESSDRTIVVNKSNDTQQQHEEDIVEEDMENIFHDYDGDIPKNRSITASGQLILPFSIHVAYDAYSNLSRQPTWSSWLDSVVVSTDNPRESLWTMKIWGIKYSWTAVAVQNIRPYLIQWRSITGLKNYGTVRLYEQLQQKQEGEGDNTLKSSCLMTMNMTFVAPRVVSAVFKQSTTLQHFVEEKIIASSLRNFRDVVIEEEINNKEEQKNDDDS